MKTCLEHLSLSNLKIYSVEIYHVAFERLVVHSDATYESSLQADTTRQSHLPMHWPWPSGQQLR